MPVPSFNDDRTGDSNDMVAYVSIVYCDKGRGIVCTREILSCSVH